jgi:hypothetical protein
MSPTIPHLRTIGQKISPLVLWEFVSAIGLSLAYFFPRSPSTIHADTARPEP